MLGTIKTYIKNKLHNFISHLLDDDAQNVEKEGLFFSPPQCHIGDLRKISWNGETEHE